MEKVEILALIPARGGSKSIPEKNIKQFAGKPLINHSIDVALSSEKITRVIVSTDCQEIADISLQAGAEVPFLRPHHLAQDDTLDYPVFEHCLKWLEEKDNYMPDLIVHLRPTSPLRTTKMIEDAIDILVADSSIDSVRAVCEPSQNPFKMWTISHAGILVPLVDSGISEQYNQPRQKLPKIYWQNGYIDVMRRETILKKRSMTGDKIKPLIIDNDSLIDIDNEVTFAFAEKMFLISGNKK